MIGAIDSKVVEDKTEVGRCEYSIQGHNCSSARLCGADYPAGCAYARRIGNRMYVCGKNPAKEGEKR